MATVILAKGQLMLSQRLRLMLDTCMEDTDMAVGSMVVAITVREMLMLNQSQMLDIMEDLVTVDMVAMEDTDMAVGSTVVGIMVKEMLMLNQRLMLDIMEDMVTVDMVAMEDTDMAVGSMGVATMVREMLMLNQRQMLDIMEVMATVDMVDMAMDLAMVVVTTLVRLLLWSLVCFVPSAQEREGM